MRSIETFDDRQRARTFAKHLATLQIETELSENGEAWSVWVLDEARIDEARSELAQYHSDPDNAKYAQAAKPEKESQHTRLLKKRAAKPRNRSITMRERWQKQPASGRSALTFLLAAICIIVTIMTDFGKQEVAFELIKMKRSAYLDWELWRFLTPVFSHGDWIHLLFNLMWLRQLGSVIEQRRGIEILLAMTLVFAAASNSLEFFMGLQRITQAGYGLELAEKYVNFHGFSGVNYGLFGYIWIKGKLDPWENIHVQPSTVLWMMIWYVVCVLGLMGPVANWAHTGGLLAGALWGFVDARIARQRRGMS